MEEECFSITGTPNQNISSINSDFWIFQHKELLTSAGTERPWNQKKLVNKLNHINFIDGFIFLILTDKKDGNSILTKAHPLPCVKDELLCQPETKNFIEQISDYSVDFLMIDDGLTAVLSPVQLISIEGNNIKLQLPDNSNVIALRKTRRHYCKDIDCQLVQNDFKAHGKLIDFTSTAMGIILDKNNKMSGFNENNPVELTLRKNGEKLYIGFCQCIQNRKNSPDGKIIFSPLSTHIQHFPKRKMRNPRQHITPSFSIKFRHPFFHKNIERDIFDISISGFSIIDSLEEETLLPGMIISDISIVYANIININCTARVLYSQKNETNNIVHHGLVITDIDIQSFTYLNHILSMHMDGHARISTNVDMEALWEFFFDTGFIYGQKYEHLFSYRNNFRKTYGKLYQSNPDIAKHFVYEKNGKIYGHISMVHAYEPSWLIHHFSARRMGNRLPGPSVLKQIIHYTGAYSRLPSSGMDHVMTYYQPNNRIIERIFGAFTKQIKNLSISSLDIFSYILLEKPTSTNSLPEYWKLRECTPIDFNVLKHFYESSSGGLVLDAFGLDSSSEHIKESFSKSGFKRDYRTYCLLYKDEQIAFFIVEQSDMGINLSDLLNDIKILVLKSGSLPYHVLLSAVNNFYYFYPENQIPLLIYPDNYLFSHKIKEEKKYALWILNAERGSDYFLEYTNALIKIQPGHH